MTITGLLGQIYFTVTADLTLQRHFFCEVVVPGDHLQPHSEVVDKVPHNVKPQAAQLQQHLHGHIEMGQVCFHDLSTLMNLLKERRSSKELDMPVGVTVPFEVILI